MGISRSSRHKRSASGAQRAHYRKKRKFELGRQPANTKLGAKRIHTVRVRGGSLKYRALRLDSGNFAWGSEHVTKKTRIIGVVYNASNNELVRTNTLVKSAIIQVDATPFRQWYESHYAQPVTKKGAKATTETAAEPKKLSNHAQRSLDEKKKDAKIDPMLESQFAAGRLYAAVSSRPGQSGRADGYILEGKELELIFSVFKTLTDQQVTVELKNDLSITGVLKSVDQFLNIRLDNIKVLDEARHPHMMAVKNCFIRGSVVRYVQLPSEHVDTQLLEDATRREAQNQAKR
ncbi:ribosomal protein S8A [Stygiomarasmius scandens]|uniref:40S ribosomal protein S8 n=1 Tax=Marasmiellus scandens TaxID=2682957 RepID=A0ABR1K780_9AGAR